MRRGLLITTAALLVTGTAFWFGREVGGFESSARIASLEQQLIQMEERIRLTGVAQAQAQQQADQAEQRRRDDLAALAEKVPQGDVAALVDLVRKKLASGMPLDRLRFVVEQVRPERQCSPGVQKKRFAPRMPSEVSPLQTVSFLDNKVTISGVGISALSKEGAAQPWFDPGQPVEIRILSIGGGIDIVKGVLPAGRSLVEDGREYRFGFASSDKRGSIEVTLQDCAYP